MPDMLRKFLLFEVQGNRYAFDLEHIAEVADPSCNWPIPLAPACFSGAIHVHGTIVAAIDLALFLGLPKVREPQKMILTHRSFAALAFLVDRVIRIVPEHEIRIESTSGSRFESFVLILPEGNASLLDLSEIVKVSEIMMV